MLMECFLI